MEKALRLEAQQRDFQNQLIGEQATHQQITGMLEELCQELKGIRNEHNNQNPMNISSSTDTAAELNHIKQQAEQEKREIEERLAKTKAEYEQVIQNKNHEVTTEIECIKNRYGRPIA